VNELSDRFDFVLIGSGGISNGVDTAKALALGADLTAAAGPILRAHSIGGIEGVISHIRHNFEIVKKIMYLTDSGNLPELDKSKLIKVNEFH
jgi:isopentenyl diphosphate isomerase/L-lactate dehydrogenase-like FMN-dependent dehydrogenase